MLLVQVTRQGVWSHWVTCTSAGRTAWGNASRVSPASKLDSLKAQPPSSSIQPTHRLTDQSLLQGLGAGELQQQLFRQRHRPANRMEYCSKQTERPYIHRPLRQAFECVHLVQLYQEYMYSWLYPFTAYILQTDTQTTFCTCLSQLHSILMQHTHTYNCGVCV